QRGWVAVGPAWGRGPLAGWRAPCSGGGRPGPARELTVHHADADPEAGEFTRGPQARAGEAGDDETQERRHHSLVEAAHRRAEIGVAAEIAARGVDVQPVEEQQPDSDEAHVAERQEIGMG